LEPAGREERWRRKEALSRSPGTAEQPREQARLDNRELGGSRLRGLWRLPVKERPARPLTASRFNTRAPFETHILDSQAGTHLVPPAHALPPVRLEGGGASPEVEEWLREYQGEFGPRGTSDLTAEKVPIAQTCGPARVIDIRHRLGATRKESWPASPEVTPEDIREPRGGDGGGRRPALFLGARSEVESRRSGSAPGFPPAPKNREPQVGLKGGGS